MVLCNVCKTELPQANEEHWTICPSCERGWQLTDDNATIKSATVEIKDVTITINAKQLLKGVQNAIRK